MTDSYALHAKPKPPTTRLKVPTDAQRLRSAFGRFPTGVCVVTFDGPGFRHGITVNSFTSVSVDPKLVLVSIARSARSHDVLLEAPFTVNVLGAEQEALAMHFAGRPNQEPSWVEGDWAPRLAGSLAHFECTPWKTYDGGDHTLVVGEVRSYGYRDGDALGFNGSRFTVIHELNLGHEFLM
ncbi:flavin reductase [Georgenia ruanii]|uniref:Flavin reductase n=2 Tax=Georgenia ruanii TaxID=348442 RepID=A0A7J9V0X8_9MICO|nr:flavin reductase [Georgenia ruanii]